MYTLGSLALTIHAIQIMDWIFIALNGFAMLMSGIALFYGLRNR